MTHPMEIDYELELTVDQIRHYLDTGDPITSLDNLLDNAQGEAHINSKTTTILIKVKP